MSDLNDSRQHAVTAKSHLDDALTALARHHGEDNWSDVLHTDRFDELPHESQELFKAISNAHSYLDNGSLNYYVKIKEADDQ